jgi:hypothetical protein
MAVGWRKVGALGEGGSGGGTSMTPVMGDENEEGEAMGCGRVWRGRQRGGEARRLHGVEAGRHSKERGDGR